MARCPDCNRFVSYGDGEVSVESVEIDDDLLITGTVRIALTCGECGTELKEANLDFDHQIDHKCPVGVPDGALIEIDDQPDADFTDRIETTRTVTKKDGTTVEKPLPSRAQRTFYGAEISGVCKCNGCAETFEWSVTVEESASAFDEL